ncbi:MAG: hypothetical protein M9936_32205 [Caldilinea sp.]|nr:hypothetical protein [Caldilinea sp.]MCB0060227.1 hypothetical protein [Caldilineaceae bacterium]MCB0048255.1 hypothetical protein [Caldilinea sp.]MCB9123503.1 hypothetical protein [Caldilineaceae bacterium]MCO5214388.1 hypothetical protein [Caldilinea sp.]
MATDSLYDTPVVHFMDERIVVAPAGAIVGDVLAELAIGQTLVITGADGFPAGVLPEEVIGSLPDPAASLHDVFDHWLPPTVTPPETPLEVLWAGMLADATARWHVVFAGEPVGVVSPTTLFTLVREQQRRQPLDLVPEPVRQVLEVFADLPRLLATTEMLPGKRFDKPDLRCFRCPQGSQPHYICRGRVVRANPHAAPTCPDHAGQAVVAVTPCPGSCT